MGLEPVNLFSVTERITLFAEVLLPLPLPKLYTYRVPYEWNELMLPGLRVAVPFGVKKVYSGIIWSLSEQAPEGYQAHYITEILDDEILVERPQREFWEWMARYYMAHLGDVMQVALPAGFRVQSQTKITLHPAFDPDELALLDPKENQILGLLLQQKSVKVEDIQQLLNQKSVMKIVKTMYLRGVISMEEELRENYKPKRVSMVELNDLWLDNDAANDALNALEKKAPKQFNAILGLLGKGMKPQVLGDFLKEYNTERSVIKSLQTKGLLRVFEEQVARFMQTEGQGGAYTLNAAQAKARESIFEGFELNKPVLLFGVTGSGKTLLYIEAAKAQIKAGKQVLFLVPEVALTENLVDRISQYLDVPMGVWHHYYSVSERTELYQEIRSGRIQVLLGTRSAIFAPFCNLGLIVIDEEHEPGYKQFEKRPYFHARDAAFYLSRQYKAQVLLGSASPSYEMWELAQRNQVHLVRLNARFEAREATAWNWLDLKLLKEQNRYKELLSDPLLDALTEALKLQKRIIVYHNRKGFAPYIQCGLCGYTTQCLNCDISLTYYKSSQNQRCNYCGYQQSLPKICPGCGGNDFQMKGAGTEKWVDELQTLFPEARIARFDQQSISKRSDFQRIINEFHRGDIDILVGTQLLAKGIDFEDVVHIAVPEGDMPLNNPDFRSNERSFQQYHQLAGRAGRGKESGQIWIQTYRKEHAVFRALEAGDYEALADDELESRKAFGYPPFGRLIEVRLRHKDEPNVLQAAIWFNNALRSHFGDRLLGPITPSIARVKSQYIQQFLIKFDAQQHSAAKIKEYLWQQRLRLLQGEGMNALQVDFDVDP